MDISPTTLEQYYRSSQIREMGLRSALSLAGKTFGRWSVVRRMDRGWLCRCSCGVERIVRGDGLESGRSSSCGCYHNEMAAKRLSGLTIDLTGMRFGRLVVLSRSEKSGSRIRWICGCDCGKKTEVLGSSLVRGATRSCGCYHKEVWQGLIRNPDLTEEDREEARQRRVDPRNVIWRKEVYKRDGYVCQVCGDGQGGNLVAHHKDSWRTNPDKRFEVDNGVTTCEECHGEFHSIFGYGENTKDQWELFIKSKGVDGVKFDRPVRRRIGKDLVGQKFGRLNVMVLDDTKKVVHWLCRCDCGVVKSVDGHGMKRGQIKSCGCLQRDQAREMGLRNRRKICLTSAA